MADDRIRGRRCARFGGGEVSSKQAHPALRANISETGLVLLINEE